MKNYRLITFILICFQIFLFSCSKEPIVEPSPPAEQEIVLDPTKEGGLVSFERVSGYTQASIRSSVVLAKTLGLQLDESVIKYDIELYKIEYKVNYKGNLITASGLLALPVLSETKSLPAYSFQHGTILLKSDAPSLDLANFLLPIELFLPASMGMMAVMPDYIGFGSSADIFHPYYVKEPSALAILDLLKAAKNFASQKKYTISNKLHLVGYSQGGYTSLAAHQYLSQNPSYSTFTDFTTYSAAGGYDLLHMQEIILKRDTYEQPYYLGYILKAYQGHYGFTQPTWADLLNAPYSERIGPLMDGSKSGGEVNAALTNNVRELFKENFLTNYASDQLFANLNNQLIANSLTEIPSSKYLYLYHGKEDTWVFPETTISTYQKLLEKGSNNISYIELNGNHTSAFIPFANDVFTRLVGSLQ